MKRLTLALAFLALASCRRPSAPSVEAVPAAPAQQPAVAIAAPIVSAPELPAVHQKVVSGLVKRNETLSKTLLRLGLDGDQSREVLGALAGVLDFRRSRIGDELLLTYDGPALLSLVYRTPPFDEWKAERQKDQWVARKRELAIEKKVVQVDVPIQSSLYESLQRTGADPELAMALADVFAWDVDFYSDVRNGDEVKALVEEYIADGKVLRIGDVLGAEYKGQVVGQKKIFRYQDPSGNPSYFNADGSSARKAFLKSPLKYAHITSGFGMRFHPILKYEKQHEGVDYGAAQGTPVWAVGDGVVTFAGNRGANGNFVCIKHRNGLESCYCHLQGFGEGIHTGASVAQKRVIGFVGMTGRATGPHLHFALKRDGHFLNPLTQKFPRAEPVPPALLADFHAQIDPFVSRLEATSVAEVTPKPTQVATP